MLDDSFKIRYTTVPLAINESWNWNTDQHNHSEFEMLYFEKGSATVKIGAKSFSVDDGDLVFVNPMEVHSIKVDGRGENSQKCICFDCSMAFYKKASDALQTEIASVIRHIPSNNPHNAYLKDLFLKIYDASVSEHSKTETDGEIYAMEMQAYISLLFAYIFKNSLLDSEGVKSKNVDFERAVIDYVKKHYNEPITSKEVAKELSFNQSYFCRNFKKNFGVNFTDYLNTYRLSLSRKMLEENKSVTQVALDCGFISLSKFSKCFKKAFGLLPSKYKSKSQ